MTADSHPPDLRPLPLPRPTSFRYEELLRELQHARVVALGQAEDGEDDVQRVLHRDLAGEVALATQLLQLGHRSVGELGEAVAVARSTVTPAACSPSSTSESQSSS